MAADTLRRTVTAYSSAGSSDRCGSVPGIPAGSSAKPVLLPSPDVVSRSW